MSSVRDLPGCYQPGLFHVFFTGQCSAAFHCAFQPPGFATLVLRLFVPNLKYSTSHRSRYRLRIVYIVHFSLNYQLSISRLLTDQLSSCRAGHILVFKSCHLSIVRKTVRRLTVGFRRANSGLNQMAFFHFEAYIERICCPGAWIVGLS